MTGNHEFYAGLDRSLRTFEASGISVLRDSATEIAPGLVMAGVDDLSARRQFGVNGMTLIVSRGTGFWGPPMRLFRRVEIAAITLRAR